MTVAEAYADPEIPGKPFQIQQVGRRKWNLDEILTSNSNGPLGQGV